MVDDSKTARRVLMRILVSLGHETPAEAADGVEAIEILRAKGPFDLVLSDLNMPRLDGLGLIRAMRADARTAETPVLVISSENDPDRIFEAVRAGGRGYVLKPFQPSAIRRRITDALNFAKFAARNEAPAPIASRAEPDDPPPALAGTIDELPILELLQFLSIQSKTGELRFETPALTADVLLQAGVVKAASAITREQDLFLGTAALDRLALESRGSFRLEAPHGEYRPDSAVDVPTVPLLFDLARKRDEAEAAAAAAGGP